MTGLRLLASYPKSGNTWMRMFIESLAAGGEEPDINATRGAVRSFAGRGWVDRVLDGDSTDLTEEEVCRLRPRLARALAARGQAPIIKAHDAFLPAPGADEPAFPADAIDRVVFIVRDPRDVALSFASFFGVDLERAVERMGAVDFQLGRAPRGSSEVIAQFLSSWSRNVESWLDAPVRRHILRYEDMLDDPQGRLAAAAAFLGLDAAEAVVATACAAVRFERLAGQEIAAGGFRETPGKGRTFFRQGRKGGWRETLPPALARRIETEHGPAMRRLGYI